MSDDSQQPAKRQRGRPRKHPAPDPDAPKRPRGRPRREPGTPPAPASAALRAAWDAALSARWGERGASHTVRVDPDAADALARVPERDRRRVASDAIRAAVRAYFAPPPPSPLG